MENADDLRAKAAKCRHLAETMISDPLTVERLNQLADELDAQADAIETGRK